MTRPEDPTLPNTGNAPPAAGGDAPPRLPGGVKVLIGCLAVLGIGFVAVAAALGVGGFALSRGIRSAVGGVEEHAEAGRTLDRLEREHPFTVPGDGTLTEPGIERFAAVTARAWERMRGWAEELEALDARREADRAPGLRDAIGGVRAVGGFARSRVELARALDAEGVSLSEYVWTGNALRLAAAGGESVPAANMELARRHARDLPDFEGDDPGPALVLWMAMLWARADLPEWRSLGFKDAPGG